MSFRDLLAIAGANLWRMKLRTLLTVAGVVIAIGALVALLSFGAGNRALITDQFYELGLFTTMQVYPPRESSDVEPGTSLELDDRAVLTLSRIPGVRLAYPFDSFEVTAAIADTVVNTEAQALPQAAVRTKLYSQLVAGRAWSANETQEVLVTDAFADQLDTTPEALLGAEIRVSVRVASLDSALTYALRGQLERVENQLGDPRLDGLTNREYLETIGRLAREEAGAAAARFVEGFLDAPETITDTLTVCGVLEGRRGRLVRTRSILLPTPTARRFSAGRVSNNPAGLLAALQSGTLFAPGSSNTRSYAQVTLDLDAGASHEVVADSVEVLGFRAFSFAREFDEIRKFFLLFNLALSAVGLVALVTAALGIVNTMMMSISERRREIGVLRALGADDGRIRQLFLVESGVIGAAGAAGGIALGWIVSRIGSGVARLVMERQDIDAVELFATPVWLVLTAIVFGVAVSVLAGLYPATRAARVDPVEALRQE